MERLGRARGSAWPPSKPVTALTAGTAVTDLTALTALTVPTAAAAGQAPPSLSLCCPLSARAASAPIDRAVYYRGLLALGAKPRGFKTGSPNCQLSANQSSAIYHRVNPSARSGAKNRSAPVTGDQSRRARRPTSAASGQQLKFIISEKNCCLPRGTLGSWGS